MKLGLLYIPSRPGHKLDSTVRVSSEADNPYSDSSLLHIAEGYAGYKACPPPTWWKPRPQGRLGVPGLLTHARAELL